jgi:hypothetical protein
MGTPTNLLTNDVRKYHREIEKNLAITDKCDWEPFADELVARIEEFQKFLAENDEIKLDFRHFTPCCQDSRCQLKFESVLLRFHLHFKIIKINYSSNLIEPPCHKGYPDSFLWVSKIELLPTFEEICGKRKSGISWKEIYDSISVPGKFTHSLMLICAKSECFHCETTESSKHEWKDKIKKLRDGAKNAEIIKLLVNNPNKSFRLEEISEHIKPLLKKGDSLDGRNGDRLDNIISGALTNRVYCYYFKNNTSSRRAMCSSPISLTRSDD